MPFGSQFFQGMPPERLQRILETIADDPLEAAELMTTPIPVLGDVVGGAAGARRFSEDPSARSAAIESLGLLPFVSGGVIRSFLPKRADQLTKELEEVDKLSLKASAQQQKLDAAINDLDDAQTLQRALRGIDPSINEITRGRLKKKLTQKLRTIKIEDPFTGDTFLPGNMSEQEMLDLRSKFRTKGRAIEMRRGILEGEFSRLDEVTKQLKEELLFFEEGLD